MWCDLAPPLETHGSGSQRGGGWGGAESTVVTSACASRDQSCPRWFLTQMWREIEKTGLL